MIFILAIQALAIYLCIHLALAFSTVMPRGWALLLTAVCVLIGESFFIVFTLEYRMGIKMPGYVADITSNILILVFYITCLYMVSDVLRLLRLYPSHVRNIRIIELGVIFVVALCIVGYGMWNARRVVLREVDILTSKPGIDSRIVFLSDLHIGASGMNGKKMQKIVDLVNGQDADIVILGGDIVDRYYQVLRKGKYAAPLQGMKSKYGTYAVLGNHEYYRNNIQDVIKAYRELGFTVLRDEKAFVKGVNMEFIGLDDPTYELFYGEKTKPMKKLIDPQDKSFKLVVVHNPKRIPEAIENGVDLMLAGHTHNGQIFPVNLILEFMYKTVWGHDIYGDTQVYVSSGVGLWGPAIRTGSDSEVVLLKVRTSGASD